MNFIVYDLSLLVIFAIFIAIFLYRGKKNLQKDGLLLLYRTSWGIKLINHVGNKYKKTLRVLSYVTIGLGYVLMGMMLYLAYQIVRIYIFLPWVVTEIKIPPITPLIPYLPQVFKIDFLPPFYFTYWIIILAVIAITHELAHGIFAAYNKIRIKKTGFGFFPFFLPVFLAAFVELDEKKMAKEPKFKQMAVLSAGTFANVITAALFFVVIWLFFTSAFIPSGIIYDEYAYSFVGLSAITMVNGISVDNPTNETVFNFMNNGTDNEIIANGERYIALLGIPKDNSSELVLYQDAPAINAGLSPVITHIEGELVEDRETLTEILGRYGPGDVITITHMANETTSENAEVTLNADPSDPEKAWLGIGFFDQKRRGIMGTVYTLLSSFKDPHVYYKSRFEASLFIYNLLWWLILISISVALVNMLPVGIFDGGRFFYLTVLGITKSEKFAKKSFKVVTWFFLLVLVLIMVFWARAFFV